MSRELAEVPSGFAPIFWTFPRTRIGQWVAVGFGFGGAVEGAELFDGFGVFVVAFEAGFAEHFAGNAGDELGEGPFDAVADEFLSALCGPEFFFDFGEGDCGFFGVQIFPFSEEPDEFRVAGQRDGEGNEFGNEFGFVGGGVGGFLADFDLGGEGAVGGLEFDVEGVGFFVLGDFDVVAKGVVELFFDVHDGGGLEVRELDVFAEFFESGDLVFAAESALDVVDDFGGEVNIVGMAWENCFEKFEDVAF